MRKDWCYESKYIIFYFTKPPKFELSFEICGYFDNRPRIRINPWFFNLSIILPFKNKWKDECYPPKIGFAYHNQTFLIYRGGKGNMKGGNKWWTFHMPWELKWYRTSFLRKDGTLETEHGKHDKELWNRKKWDNILWNKTYDYTYVLKSGEIQKRKAKLLVQEMEWRRRWLMFFPWFRLIRKSIDIRFDDEVGEETGSWKGGCTGCGYNMLPEETPLQTLRRMEKERKF